MDKISTSGHQQPRQRPARALSPAERFVDRSPGHVVAALLDKGQHLCSESTMYRVLREAAPVVERRSQRRHPEYVKPQVVATAPNLA